MSTQHTPEPLIKTINGNAYVSYADYNAVEQQRDELQVKYDELLDTLRCFANGEITNIDGVILLSAAAIAKAGYL